MEDEEKKGLDLDILKKVETLSNQVNGLMASVTRPFFKKYPLTFMLLILIGAVALSEGLKDILNSFSFFANHPWRLLMTGLIILIATGTLYKKLKK